jgi:hypothetical protein
MPATILAALVDPDPRDQLATVLNALVAELSLPDGVITGVTSFLTGFSAALRQPAELDVVPALALFAQATGAALPATVRVEPGILTLVGVEVTPVTGDVPVSGPAPLRTQQDLVIGAIIVLYVCLAWVCLTARPLPEALIEPLAVAIGLLAPWAYGRR